MFPWQNAILFLVGLTCISATTAIKLDVFATKTLYEWSHDVTQIPAANKYSTVSYKQAQCEAIHVSVAARHGTRNPSDGSMEDIAALYKKLLVNKDATKFTDLEGLQKSHLYNPAEEKILLAKGVEEMSGLGERFSKMFSRLFATNRFQFVSSSKKRNTDSSKAFYDGIAKHVKNIAAYKYSANDTRLRFYDDCYNFEHGVEENKTNMIHFALYANTSAFQDVVTSVKSTLGLKISLSPDDIHLMYDICAYEMYVHNSTRWCDMMTDADRETVEYREDIKNYYERGYGHPLNTDLSCALVQDMFRTMDSAKNNTSDVDSSGHFNYTTDFVAGKFQFGHSETHIQLLTGLQLYKDAMPLLETNRATMGNRKFRISKIGPFAGNVALALYACNDVSKSVVARILVNEEGVVNPACGQTVCPYDQMRVFYGDLINSCDRKALCDKPGDPSGSPPLGVSLLLLLMGMLLQHFQPFQ